MKRFTLFLLVFSVLLSSLGIMPVSADKKEFPFTDIVQTQQSGYLNVKALWEKGIIEGKTDTLFAPNDPLTREEAAKIITLAAQMTPSSNKGTFIDAVSGSWYEQHVETINESGLMKGIGNGQFGTGKNITRQDVAVILVRMAEYLDIEIQNIGQFQIADIADVSDYAKESVQKLVNFNVIDLVSNRFNPKDAITRIDFCIWLDRLLISDVKAYDDYIQDWMPEEKDATEYDFSVKAMEDFENGVQTLGDYIARHGVNPATEHIVEGVGVDGSNCIVLEGESDGYAAVELYMYDVEPTTNYFMSWDMKTEGLGDCYARVNMEWYSPSGTQISGNFIRDADTYGDTDWKHYDGTNQSPTPDMSTGYLRIVFSIRGQTTGKLYVDNLKLYTVIFEPVTSYLKKPAYKGLITDPNGESDIQLTTYIHGLGSTYDPKKCELITTLSDMEGNVINESKITEPTEEMELSFSSKDLDIGDYALSTKLMDIETGREIGVNNYAIRKREPDFQSLYRFDEYGRLLKNGEPYFPMGVYARNTAPEAVEDFKDSPIDFVIENSVGRYWTSKEVMEKLAEYGVESMMSMESVYKNAMRAQWQNPDVTSYASEREITKRLVEDLNLVEHPAHMGYQTNNEGGAGEWAPRLKWHQKIFDDIDFDHLTYGVGVGNRKAAIDYAGAQDVYAPDPYPIEGLETDTIEIVYEIIKGFYETSYNRPVWSVLQISDLGPTMGGSYSHRKRGPNEEELRNMAWQAVCAGAQSIIWYAHFHLCINTKYTNKRIDLDNDKNTIIVYENGKISTMDAITNNSVISIACDAYSIDKSGKLVFDYSNASYTVIYVSNATQTGMLEQMSDTEYVIDGRSFTPNSLLSVISDLKIKNELQLTSTYRFSMDAFGTISDYELLDDVSDMQYGYLMKAGVVSNGFDNKMQVQILENNSELVIYDVRERYMLDGDRQVIEGGYTLPEVLKSSQLIRYKLADGALTVIDTAAIGSNEVSEASLSLDYDGRKGLRYWANFSGFEDHRTVISPDTKVFYVTDDVSADESAFTAGTPSDFLSSQYYNYESYDIGEFGKTGCILLYSKADESINFQTRAYMLEKVVNTLDNAGDPVVRLYLHGYMGSITRDLVDDTQLMFTDLSESSVNTISDLKKGDIVRFAENASGKVIKLERAFTVTKEPAMHIDDLTAGGLHYEYGTLYNTNSTHFEAMAKTDFTDITEEDKKIFAYKSPSKVPVYNMKDNTVTLFTADFHEMLALLTAFAMTPQRRNLQKP